jgi:ribosomal protein S18 acetylase RimI-like enzyme
VTHDRDEATTVADRVVTMDQISGTSVVELHPVDTWPLRRAVLRNDTPSHDVVFDGDDEPTTVHLGVADRAGRVIATSTWLRRPFPGAMDGVRPAIQLRAMAIDPGHQRRGIGRRLVEAGLERMAADGAGSVWANARDTALDFYVGLGFEIVGEGFVDPTTALPHHRIVRRL